MTSAASWRLQRRRADAATLHDSWPPAAELGTRTAAVCEPTSTALVLGSTQPLTLADGACLDARHVDLVRRRSGGGVVLVAPHAQVWIDVWVPHGDALWRDDIVLAPQWVGEAWALALASLGVPSHLVSVHRGRSIPSEWAKVICFAGLGPGEVSVDGRKVVGISQRRTRHGTRISTTALIAWEPDELVRLLALAGEDRRRLVDEVGDVAAGLRDVVPGNRSDSDSETASRVADAVLAHLPVGG